MEIFVNNKKIKIRLTSVLYVLVFVLFTLFVIKDLDYNTAFVDEAIYATVGEEALRGSFWERGLSWMGGSYVYPVISAFINRNLGLWGVRLFSVFTVLVSAVVAGEIAKVLGGSKARVISVAMFLFSGIAMNLAQLGTYDAPALLFFSLAFYMGLVSRDKGKLAIIPILLSSALFSLAVLSKYVSVLLAPAILLSLFRFKWSRVIYAFIWVMIPAASIGSFVYLNFDSLYIFFTGDAFKAPATYIGILKNTFEHLGVLAPLSIFGAILVLKKQRQNWILLMALIAGSMAPFSYHFVFLNDRSMWKHLVFSAVMLSPLSSIFILFLYRHYKRLIKRQAYFDNASQIAISITILIIVLLMRTNFRDHWNFQRSWPSATSSIEFLSANRREGDIVFAEVSSVYKYHLFEGFQNPETWQSTWYVNYKGLQGLDGMKLAIEEGYYDFIVLNGYFSGDVVYELLPVINEYYDVADRDVYKVSGVYDIETFVWVPKGSDREYFGLN